MTVPRIPTFSAATSAGVLQGRFAGGRFHPAVRPGTAQPQAQAQGHAQALPPGLLRPTGGGRPLPDAVRSKMESFFGADFSDVRVHVGSEAPSIGALAFTIGSSLYFAPGQYNPDSSQGQSLLGHELTHVVQQRAGRVRNPFGSGIAVVQDPHLEAEADRMGARAANHVPAAAVQAKPVAGGRGSGQRLIVGAYLHSKPGLPDAMAGHGFVAIEGPSGRREAWGFSPADRDRIDPHRDLGRLTGGVRGEVHRDDSAFAKSGVRIRSVPINAEQASAALAKVAEYRSGHVPFSFARTQCTTFAADVARAAGVELAPGGRAGAPREFYRKI